MEHILNEIRKERERQDSKWGEQNNKPMEWIPIIMEELGEASKEALEHYFRYPDKLGSNPSDNYQKMRLELYRKELIETAAVCVNAIQCLDRNELYVSNDDLNNKFEILQQFAKEVQHIEHLPKVIDDDKDRSVTYKIKEYLPKLLK